MPSPTLRFLASALTGLLISGCGGEVTVETDALSYAPGTCVGIIATNPRMTTMMVDHCFPPLERQTDSGWEVVPPAEDEVCLLWGLGAGAFDRVGFWARLPADLREGTYRYRVSVDWSSPSETAEIPSEPFSVAGPAGEQFCEDGSFDPDDPEPQDR